MRNNCSGSLARAPFSRLPSLDFLLWLGLGLCVAVYVALWGVYSCNDIDNSWTTAWIYNFCVHGNPYDVIFREGVPHYWGVRFFSHIFCWIYGGIASLFGYTRDTLVAVSTFWTISALYFWYRSASMLFASRRTGKAFLVLLALSGVVVAASMKVRVDAFVFAIEAFSFYLLLRGRYFWSVLVGCIAVETHPIGICVFCYHAAYLLFREPSVFNPRHPARLLKMLAGALLGAGLFLVLHGEALPALPATLDQATGEKANFLWEHFFGRFSYPWRFWPEFALFIVAFLCHVAFLRKREDWFFPGTVVLFLLVSVVITRGNFHYALFAYPAFLLLSVHLASRLGTVTLPLLLVGWFLLMVPQYVFLAWRNHPGRGFNDYIAALQRVDLPRDLPVYGMPNDYFAFVENPGFRTWALFKGDREAYLICHDRTIFMQPDWKGLAKPPRTFHRSKIISFPLRSGGTITIWHAWPDGVKPVGDPVEDMK